MICNKVLFGTVTFLELIEAGVVMLIAVFIGRVLTLFAHRRLRDRISKHSLDLVLKAITYTIIIIAFITDLRILHFKLSGLLVAGGITGIVVAFASQNIVSNLVSGVFLLFERPIRIGQAVNIENTTGVVEDIRIISTIIRTYEGLYVRVPNEKVFTNNITNYEANIVRRFEYTIGIRYSDDAEKAIAVIKQEIQKHPYILINPAPLVYVEQLGESSVIIAIKLWSPVSEWFGVKTEMLWKLKKAIEAAGIVIPFPQRVLYFPEKPELPKPAKTA